jgi:hypothetical protein
VISKQSRFIVAEIDPAALERGGTFHPEFFLAHDHFGLLVVKASGKTARMQLVARL